MLLDKNSELQLRATRPKPLMISILVHSVLIAILVIFPFENAKRRVIRIAGEDFDLSRLQLTPLVIPKSVPPAVVPATPPPPAQPAPLVPPQQAAPPPPPPPPPPAPPPQNRVIRPDDLLVEGARPDGAPQASRGDTREQARAGGPSAREAQEALEAQRAQEAEARRAQEAREAQERQAQQLASNQSPNSPNRVLPNLNPALRTPTLLSEAGRIVEANLATVARNQTQGRTGVARSNNLGTFSADPQILSPNPKGIDFGPYLNQLLTRLRSSWYSVMPEVARLGQRGRVDIVFTVTRLGEVKDLQVVSHSGHDALDKGALSAIQLSNPFQRLPAEYETDLKLRIAFLYNMNP
jgi:TonB family protein